MLAPKQTRFVEEYLIDLNGKQAAIRAGYSARSAEVQAARLLGYAKVHAAVREAMQARSRRTGVTADRVVAELAMIGFANMRDLWPRRGERIDLDGLDQDRAAAVEEITIDESIDPSGVLHPRIHLKLRDKIGALSSLARHLGMLTDRNGAEGSIERRVMRMRREGGTRSQKQRLGEQRGQATAQWQNRASGATSARSDGDC
jgi:phage terminase small subunit